MSRKMRLLILTTLRSGKVTPEQHVCDEGHWITNEHSMFSKYFWLNSAYRAARHGSGFLRQRGGSGGGRLHKGWVGSPLCLVRLLGCSVGASSIAICAGCRTLNDSVSHAVLLCGQDYRDNEGNYDRLMVVCAVGDLWDTEDYSLFYYYFDGAERDTTRL